MDPALKFDVCGLAIKMVFANSLTLVEFKNPAHIERF